MFTLAIEAQLQAHVEMLAGSIGQRRVLRPGALSAAADYIASRVACAGLRARAGGVRRRGRIAPTVIADRPGARWRRDPADRGALRYACVAAPGRTTTRVGWRGCWSCRAPSPELEPERTMRFVAFINEEPPFCFTEHMGSAVHAQAARARSERIVLMVSLEMLGYYDERPGEPALPAAVSLVLPGPGRLPGLRRRPPLPAG